MFEKISNNIHKKTNKNKNKKSKMVKKLEKYICVFWSLYPDPCSLIHDPCSLIPGPWYLKDFKSKMIVKIQNIEILLLLVYFVLICKFLFTVTK